MLHELDTPRARAAERFALRLSAGLVAVVAAGVGFVLLLTTVRSTWRPLYGVDQAVTDALNTVVAGNDLLIEVLRGITDFGGRTILSRVLVIGLVYLLIRRQYRLAAYLAATAVGALVLDPIMKLLVGRIRPVVDVPVASAPGMSFPSGHALGSFVSYGVLLLVFLPALRRRLRAPVAAVLVLLVVLVGLTRIALGVHFLSDVVAGWLLGTVWLGVTTVAFRRWRREGGAPQAPVIEGLAPEAAPELDAAPDGHQDRPAQLWLAAARLAVAWVLILGALFGAGMLITTVFAPDNPLLSADRATVRWLVEQRTPMLTDIARVGSSIGNTHWILAGTVTAITVGLALLRVWRPAVFLAVVMVGEVTLFMAASTAVTRARPPVPSLGPELPPTASFPSGHVAATICLYTAVALLVWHTTTRWWRWAAVAAALLASAAVALSRMYEGAHYPSDTVGSALLALAWVAAVWRVVRPVPPRGRQVAADLGRQGERGTRIVMARGLTTAGRDKPGPHTADDERQSFWDVGDGQQHVRAGDRRAGRGRPGDGAYVAAPARRPSAARGQLRSMPLR